MSYAVKLSKDVYDRLKRLSEHNGIPMNRLVADWIEKNESHKVVTKTEIEEEISAMCDECEKAIPEDAVFCPYCGVEFEEEDTVTCDKCEKEIPEDAAFCPHCGAEVEEEKEE